MRSVLFLLAISTISYGFLLDVGNLGLSDEMIKYIADMSRKLPEAQKEKEESGKGNKDAVIVTRCVDQNWNGCQFEFNKALGIDTSLTWRQGDQLSAAISAVLSTNQTGVMSVCNDNTRFYQCLGTSYYDCMDLYRIIRQKDADLNEAWTYVATYLQLQFLCNAGFEEVMKDYYCFVSLGTTQAVQACTANFTASITSPSQMCSQVNQADACLNAAYQAGCSTAEAGWWGCEEFRVAFDSSCYGLRCNVNHG